MNRIDRLGLGDRVIILDGPMGTELHRRGVPTPPLGWSAHALLTHPGVVRAIHDEYIAAGADVITTNTFRTNARAIRNAGLGDMARQLTATAVGMAREAAAAAGRRVLVAGSVAPVEDCYRPDLVPTDGELQQEHAQLIGWLVEDGVDLIKIETMNTLREAVAAVNAARALTDLPVLAGVVCGAGARLLSGEPVADAARMLEARGADAFMINCSSVADTTAALAAVAGATSMVRGAYANGGMPDPETWWSAENMIGPGAYATAAVTWHALGARLIGSCCGTGPDHVAKLRLITWE